MNDTLKAVAEVLRAIAWPGFAVFAVIYFRQELRGLIKRIRRASGVEFDQLPQSAEVTSGPLSLVGEAAGAPSASGELLATIPHTPATAYVESLILDLPQVKILTVPQERERVFLRMASRAAVISQFNQAEATIWASQINMLEYLNAKRAGETLAQLKAMFYDNAASQYPELYRPYSFDGWMAFLKHNDLVRIVDGSAAVTQVGIEYLMWRAETGRVRKIADKRRERHILRVPGFFQIAGFRGR